MKKLLLLILLLTILVLPVATLAQGGTFDDGDYGGTFDDGDYGGTFDDGDYGGTFDDGGGSGGLVPCGNTPDDPCGISNFFEMLVNIYRFIVFYIATPLAVIALTVGGIMMMISAGNPDLMGKGKTILKAAIIGLVLVWASWLIINTILCTILGYCTWSTL